MRESARILFLHSSLARRTLEFPWPPLALASVPPRRSRGLRRMSRASPALVLRGAARLDRLGGASAALASHLTGTPQPKFFTAANGRRKTCLTSYST
jgi:hypothetical protein